MAIPKTWLKRIDKAAKTVATGDLYHALHHVGSDYTKSEIEKVLRGILPEDTFNRVVAVFKIATSD